MANIAITSFNSGELTPQIDARSDVEKYSAGCKHLDNMIPLIYGGAERRPGTRFIYEAKESPVAVRLIPFIYSAEIAYPVEFGNMYARFYYDGEILMNGGVPVEAQTPYLTADLPALQYRHLADTMWLVHRNYPQAKLIRTNPTIFSHDDIVFTKGPFLLRNDILKNDGVTMDCDATVVGTTGILTCSADYFVDGHIGALFKLIHPRTTSIMTLSGPGPKMSDPIDVKGIFHFITRGSWAGTVELQRNENGAGWDTFRTYKSATLGERNVQLSPPGGETADNVQYQIYAHDGMSAGFSADIELVNTLQEGIVRIDSIGGTPKTANVTVVATVDSTGTTVRWAEGAWSSYRDYPLTVGFFENRCIYAGRQTVWFSKTGDYENFEEGVRDSDSFSVQLTTQNEIRWVESISGGVVIGTSGSPWFIESNKIGTPLTPTSFSLKEQAGFGNCSIEPAKVNDAVLSVDYVRRKIREFAYNVSEGKYAEPDLTALAEHITEQGIAWIAHQKNPESILWFGLASGELRSMVYERDHNVIACSRHSMSRASLNQRYEYPLLRTVDPLTLPATPTEPDDTTLVAPTSITTAAGLQAIAAGAGHYSIDANIDCSGVIWTPISGFTGVIEGNHHTISNLNMLAPEDAYQYGMFSSLGGEIRNLNFLGCSVGLVPSDNWKIAVLTGEIAANCVLKNIHFTDCSIDGIADAAGFLVGRISNGNVSIFDCTATNCSLNIATSPEGWSSWDCGVLIGEIYWNTSTDKTINIVDCFVKDGSISGAGDIGGFIGNLTVRKNNTVIKIFNCYSTAEVRCSEEFAGGFIGAGPEIRSLYSAVHIINCYSTGDVSCNTIAGGEFIAGFCSYIEIRAPGHYKTIGSRIVVMRCYSTGDVRVDSDDDAEFIGGFCGDISIDLSIYKGNGQNAIFVSDCYSTGDITITLRGYGMPIQFVGGFSGYIQSNQFGNDFFDWFITRAEGIEEGGYWNWTWDDVWNSDEYWGYIVLGWTPKTKTFMQDWPISPDLVLAAESKGSNLVIRNCYSTGNIVCKQLSPALIMLIGGFAGDIEDNCLVTNSYSLGDITCITDGSNIGDCEDILDVGGFVGYLGAANSLNNPDCVCSVSRCYSRGSITCSTISGNRDYTGNIYDIGGFAGFVYLYSPVEGAILNINNCYTWGDLTCQTIPAEGATNYQGGEIYEVGGFCGWDGATITRNVYSIGTITTSILPTYTGGLIGYNTSTIRNTYWDMEHSELVSSDGGAGRSTILMKTQSTYFDWNFYTIWYMPTAEFVNSGCVIPSVNEDEIWLGVTRKINNADHVYIEQMQPRWWENQADCFFVDCGIIYEGDATNIFTGLNHLEGETVSILGDGAVYPPQKVVNGQITISGSVQKAHIGLPFRYKVQPMRIVTSTPGGTTQGSIEKIPELVLSFLKTGGAKYGANDDELFDIDWRTTEPYDSPPALFTGEKTVVLDGGFSTENPIIISGEEPLPCTVRCIVARIEKTGR